MQEKNKKRKSRTGEESRERERKRLRGKRWGTKRLEERAGHGWRADTGASTQFPTHLLGRKKLWSCRGTAHYLQKGKLSSREGRTLLRPSAVITQLICMRPDYVLGTWPSHYLNASSCQPYEAGTVITPLYRPVTCPGSPDCSWADLGSDCNRSHPWVYAFNQDRAEGPCDSGRVSSMKASYRERITGTAIYWAPTVCWTLHALCVLTH